MQPTPGDIHVNVPLTSMSVAMIQSQEVFVAAKVFPNIPVQKQSDRYYVYDRGNFNRDEMEMRAPGTESQGTGYSVDNTPTYFCNEWSLHHDIPDQVRANADMQVNADRDATLLLTSKGLIRREKFWTSKFFVGGVWTFDYDGVSGAPGANEVKQWNDAASTPIKNVRDAKRAVMERTGFMPNKLVLGRPVYDVLCDHPEILDRIKYGQTAGAPAKVTRQAIAALFEIEDLHVMDAIENTAVEGATNVHAFIGGKKGLLCYAPPAPGLMTPSAGYTFSWTGLMGNGVEGNRIRSFRVETKKSDRVEIDMAFDMKVISSELGLFWDTLIA